MSIYFIDLTFKRQRKKQANYLKLSYNTSLVAVEKAETASEMVQQLNRAANKINLVTQVISDISEQANLMALNAKIEAIQGSTEETTRGIYDITGTINRQGMNMKKCMIFCLILFAALFPLFQCSADESEEDHICFTQIDGNQYEVVTFAEFIKFYENEPETFKKMDQDGDGTLSHEEYEEYLYEQE